MNAWNGLRRWVKPLLACGFRIFGFKLVYEIFVWLFFWAVLGKTGLLGRTRSGVFGSRFSGSRVFGSRHLSLVALWSGGTHGLTLGRCAGLEATVGCAICLGLSCWGGWTWGYVPWLGTAVDERLGLGLLGGCNGKGLGLRLPWKLVPGLGHTLGTGLGTRLIPGLGHGLYSGLRRGLFLGL